MVGGIIPEVLRFQIGQPSYKVLDVVMTFSITDAAVSVLGNNKYGRIDSGYLLVRTPLLTFLPDDSGMDLLYKVVPRRVWDLATWYCVEFENLDVAVLITFDYPGGTREGTVLGIPVRFMEDRNVTEQDDMNAVECMKIRCLLVVQSMDFEDQTCFERIGCFDIFAGSKARVPVGSQ